MFQVHVMRACYAPAAQPPPPAPASCFSPRTCCSLIRQQDSVIDGSSSLVYGHYALHARWGPPSGGGSSDSGGAVAGSGTSEAEAGLASPIVTDSLWFSPPGNIVPGVFNATAIANGLGHLLQRSVAATAAAGIPAAGGGGGGGKAAGRGSGGQALLTADFVVGSSAAWQQQHVRAYFESGMAGAVGWQRRTLLVLSLCVWESKEVFPRWVAWEAAGSAQQCVCLHFACAGC